MSYAINRLENAVGSFWKNEPTGESFQGLKLGELGGLMGQIHAADSQIDTHSPRH
jgi:hypothetical protein